MSRDFKLCSRDPYDSGHRVYKKTKFSIDPGLTVLTGCNGAGKSTLILMIQEELHKLNILHTVYDNLHDGGTAAQNLALWNGEVELLSRLAFSSEGESIDTNLSVVMQRIFKYAKSLDPRDFINRSETLSIMFRPIEYNTNEVWIFFDASDSGLSIDAVIEFKRVLHLFIDAMHEKGKEAYILVSANEYEMCIDENCFDVQGLRYTRYKTYNSYKNAILRSAKYKNKSIEESQKKYAEKQKKQEEIEHKESKIQSKLRLKIPT